MKIDLVGPNRRGLAKGFNEAANHPAPSSSQLSQGEMLSFWQVFLLTSWQNHSLFSASQAGLVNNLNDGMVWGLIPILLSQHALPLVQIAGHISQ